MLNLSNDRIKVFILLFVLCFTQITKATGRTVGNGGDVIKCINQQKANFEVLDFYEAELFNRAPIDINQNFKNIDEQINFVLNRLEKVSKARADLYRQQIQSFFQEVFWLEQGGLVDIPDSDHTTKPPAGCDLLQAVNQSDPLLPSDKRYIIDRQIWNQLENTQKVGLIFHEIIYREAILAGHTNSVSTRYLNSVICSNLMNTMSEVDFAHLLQKLGFTTTTIQGLQIDLTQPLLFYPNNQLQSAIVMKNSTYNLNSIILPIRDQVQFYDNGQIESLLLSNESDFNFKGLQIKLQPFELSFYQDGQVRRFILNNNLQLKSNYFDLTVTGSVLLFPNQLPSLVDVVSGFVNLPNDFNIKKIQINGPSYFYQTGQIQQIVLNDEVIYSGLEKPLHLQGLLKLDEQQNPEQFSISRPESISIQNQTIPIKPFTFIQLKNKHIISAILQKNASLKNQNGKLNTYFADERVSFTEDGLVKN